jgi:DNA-binding GntR family transcriptional regulator
VLERQTLDAAAADELRRQILRGDLRAGDRLTEEACSEQLGVSRPTVRAALQMLSDCGLTTRLPFVGWSVTTFGFNDLREVAQLRAALEGFAARLIVESRCDLTEVNVALQTLQAAQPPDVDEADQQFHAALVRAAGNERLAAQHRSISDQLLLAIATANLTAARGQSVGRQHDHLLRVLGGDDPDLAEATVRMHCLGVLERIPAK